MSPDEIERLRAEGERMAEMFAKDVYIESANLEPGHYDLRLKGKGCMLLAGQLTQMFYDSGGKNFITSSIEHQFSDGKDVFALTIQKMSGDDTPAQKLERQAKRIAELEAEKKRRLYNYRYRFCFLRSERDAALAAYPKRIAKQRAALKKLGHKYHERGDDIAGLKSKAGMLQAALVEERAKRCSLIDMHVAPRVTNEFKIQPRYMRSLARQQLEAEYPEVMR